MQGHIAQVVALVAHANGALRGLERPTFFPGNSTTQYCEWIRFVDATEVRNVERTERPIADSPDDWFERLVKTGARRVRLCYRASEGGLGQDFQTVAFAGGGGAWWILSDADRETTDGWLSRWALGDQSLDRRSWQVTYGRFKDAPIPDGDPSLAEAARALERSLEAIAGFSRAHADGHFLESFEKALSALRTGEPRGFHRDFGPPGGLPSEATRLLDGCQAAWVFGGMGWWNDQVFEGSLAREFDRISGEHWSSLARAIVAATNTSAAAAV